MLFWYTIAACIIAVAVVFPEDFARLYKFSELTAGWMGAETRLFLYKVFFWPYMQLLRLRMKFTLWRLRRQLDTPKQPSQE